MSEELVKASATWMEQAIRRREVSAVELLDAHAARIAERDPRVNALVVPRLREAPPKPSRPMPRSRAERPRPAAGCPSPPRRWRGRGDARPQRPLLSADHVSDADAVPMRRLRNAGAILLGKTNVPEFCSHWDTYDELFGATATLTTPRAAQGAPRAERRPRWPAR